MIDQRGIQDVETQVDLHPSQTYAMDLGCQPASRTSGERVERDRGQDRDGRLHENARLASG